MASSVKDNTLFAHHVMKDHIIPSGKLGQVEYTAWQSRVGFWEQYIGYLQVVIGNCMFESPKVMWTVKKHVTERQARKHFEVLKALTVKELLRHVVKNMWHMSQKLFILIHDCICGDKNKDYWYNSLEGYNFRNGAQRSVFPGFTFIVVKWQWHS